MEREVEVLLTETMEEVVSKIKPLEALDCYRVFLLAYKLECIAKDLEPKDYMKMVAMIKAGRYAQPDYDSCNVTFIAGINSACDVYEIPKLYTAEVVTNETGDIVDVVIDENNVQINVNIKDEDSAKVEAKKEKVVSFINNNLVFSEQNIGATDSVNPRHEKLIEDVNCILFKCLPKDDKLSFDYKVLSTGLMDLSLSKDNKFIASFTIDPNVIHGNGYYIVANSIMGNVWIPFSKTDIIKKVLAGTPDGDYILNADEVKECHDNIFINTNVYQYIDLSSVSKQLSKLSLEDYKEFGCNVDSMLLSYHTYYRDLYRYRVSKFTDINNFKLESDNKCKSPLSTMPSLFNGSSIELHAGKDIIITLENGMTTSCKLPGKNAPNLQEDFSKSILEVIK